MDFAINAKPGHGPTDKKDSEAIRDHKAIRNQSSVKPEDYPAEDRAAQSVTGTKGD